MLHICCIHGGAFCSRFRPTESLISASGIEFCYNSYVNELLKGWGRCSTSSFDVSHCPQFLSIQNCEVPRRYHSSLVALYVGNPYLFTYSKALFKCQTPPLGVSVLACEGEQAPIHGWNLWNLWKYALGCTYRITQNRINSKGFDVTGL